jgi:uncharacterized repeat protein (TIGR02543 family)
VTFGSTYGALPTTTRSGYTFAGWWTGVGGTSSEVTATTVVSTASNHTLYAKWTALPTYAVTYDANAPTDGTAPAAQTKTPGIALTLAANTGSLTRTGYTFAGWNTAADGSGTSYAVGASYTTDAALTLYAEWTALQSLRQQAGVYNGLISAPGSDPASHPQSGIARIAVTKTGSFSSTLWLGGRLYLVTGVFDGNGVAHFGRSRLLSHSLVRTGLPTLEYSLRLDLSGSDKITGIITDAGTAFASLEADRAQFTSRLLGSEPPLLVPTLTNVPASLLGDYTVIFGAKTVSEQGLPASEFPQGDGYGRMSVSASGVVRLTGRLADGTAISAANTLSKAFTWPFYSNLSAGKGSIGGTVTFRDQTGSDLDGLNLNWFKPASLTRKAYPTGWESGIKTDLVGSRYVRPLAGPSISVFPGLGSADISLGNALLTLSDGALTASPLTEPVNISPSGKVSLVSNNLAKMTVTISPSTGIWSGRFIHPDSGRVTTFHGAISQKQQLGLGFFLTLEESGAVSLVGKESSDRGLLRTDKR